MVWYDMTMSDSSIKWFLYKSYQSTYITNLQYHPWQFAHSQPPKDVTKTVIEYFCHNQFYRRFLEVKKDREGMRCEPLWIEQNDSLNCEDQLLTNTGAAINLERQVAKWKGKAISVTDGEILNVDGTVLRPVRGDLVVIVVGKGRLGRQITEPFDSLHGYHIVNHLCRLSKGKLLMHDESKISVCDCERWQCSVKVWDTYLANHVLEKHWELKQQAQSQAENTWINAKNFHVIYENCCETHDRSKDCHDNVHAKSKPTFTGDECKEWFWMSIV